MNRYEQVPVPCSCVREQGTGTCSRYTRLSDDFKNQHPEIDWKRIRGMRCHLVHGYEMFDAEIAWDAIERCIPPLKEFCTIYFEE